MTTLNISLPDTMKDFIQAQIQEGGYSTTSEYLRHLIHEEQKRVAQAKLDAMLLEGLNSGESIEINDEWWEQMKTELVDKFNKRNGNDCSSDDSLTNCDKPNVLIADIKQPPGRLRHS